MRSFSGEFTVPCDSRQAYEFLVDPNRLVKCLPDLKSHEVKDLDHFNAVLRVGVGRLHGPMNMKMEIVEKRECTYARIAGSGSMFGSRVSVDGNFTLCDSGDGTTVVKWSGNAKLGAYLMHLVGGLLDKLVQEHLDRFVCSIQSEMTGKAAGKKGYT